MAAILKLGSLLFLGIGVFVLIQAFMPILSYQYWELTTYRNNLALSSPVVAGPSNGFFQGQVLGVSIAQANEQLVSGLVATQRTYKPNFDTFTLSIPKLKIDKAIVKVDSEDPNQSLVLLPGTALPGEKGNVFIAGHSNYWQLFGTGDTRYLTIFKNLNTLEKGDKISVTAQGQTFHYRVTGMKIVDPKDVSVINPPDDRGRYISLMTCVPPGTFMKRLIILGELE